MKEITAYAVRIAGLILIVTTLVKFPAIIYAYNSQLENPFAAYFLPLLIPLVIGMILFKFPAAFSDKYIQLPGSPGNALKTEQYLYVGTILVGYILMFYSLSDIVFHISNYFYLKEESGGEITILAYDYPAAIATVVELLFSLALIIKAKYLVNYINIHNKNLLISSSSGTGNP